jgi:hypothetical protein
MTKVLERTVAISSNAERLSPFVVANIDSMQVLNWYNALAFSIYAEDGLKRYCLWSVTSFAQLRGNLYRDSRAAKQLETIARRACGGDPCPSDTKRLHALVPAEERVSPHPLIPADKRIGRCFARSWA